MENFLLSRSTLTKRVLWKNTFRVGNTWEEREREPMLTNIPDKHDG